MNRFDVAEENWNGPPDGAIGWWRGKMAASKPRQRTPTSNERLLEILAELCSDPDRQALAYLLGLLMVRRRVLRLESTEDGNFEEAQGYQCLVHPLTEERFLISQQEPDVAALASYQLALRELLYTEEG